MGTIGRKDSGEGYSFIGDKPDVGFLDFEDNKTLHDYDPNEEGPIGISIPFPFISDKPQSAIIGETSAGSVSISNRTSEPIQLWSIRIYSSDPEDSYILSLMEPPSDDAGDGGAHKFVGSTEVEDRVLQPKETLKIWVSCKPKSIGRHTGVLHFSVGDDVIERVAILLAEDNVSQALSSCKPYSRSSSRVQRINSDQYVAGHRPARPNIHSSRNRLPPFEIPDDIREIIKRKGVPDVLCDDLNRTNYSRFFSTLIVMEELSLEEEIKAHSMDSVKMSRRARQILSLEVPGLAERRPSLVRGDFILAKLANVDQENDSPTYQGFIHRVEADEIFLVFNKKFHDQHQHYNCYDVSFTYNRVNMRRLYQAVHAAENLENDLLFPSQLSHRRVIKPFSFTPLNPYINKEQAHSVKMILGCRGSPPYVVYGPPGTGKTMTLVEALLQLYKRRSTRILVCSSSNSAADHLLEKLLDRNSNLVNEQLILRLNASSRPLEDVDPAFLPFCFYDANEKVFNCPPRSALMHYKIIISTYMSASMLYAEGIRRGHFSHIFMDEAGQSSEPETMIPISHLSTKDTVIVLAGDPRQLGPVIYSKDAQRYGLGKSYLERLLECNYYVSQDENYVTKLLRNYRCHPAILDLPSRLFYNGQLYACKEEDDTYIHQYIDLPNKSFPVLFIGIQGFDEREGNNPSWFNRFEASKVMQIIRKLMSSDLSEADIGVITPYRQQVLKLKKALEMEEIENLKVGSVEQFQGQERKVIIISTVRSTVKHNDFDRAHHLGFLSNPRRFNVAITRARSLLIIVGNPHIIMKDRHWDKLLRYCADNCSYEGCPLPASELHDQSQYKCSEYDGGHSQDPEIAGWVDMPDQQQKSDGRGNDSSITTRSWNDELQIQPTGWDNEISQPWGDNDNSQPIQPNKWDDNGPILTERFYELKLGGITIEPSGWDD